MDLPVSKFLGLSLFPGATSVIANWFIFKVTGRLPPAPPIERRPVKDIESDEEYRKDDQEDKIRPPVVVLPQRQMQRRMVMPTIRTCRPIRHHHVPRSRGCGLSRRRVVRGRSRDHVGPSPLRIQLFQLDLQEDHRILSQGPKHEYDAGNDPRLYRRQTFRFGTVRLDGIEDVDEDEKYCDEQGHASRNHLRVDEEADPRHDDEESRREVVGHDVEGDLTREYHFEACD